MNTVQRHTLEAIIALVPISAKKDVRYYLKGVNLNGSTGELRLRATNGAMMTFITCPGEETLSDLVKIQNMDVILDRDDILLLKSLLKAYKTHDEFSYVLTKSNMQIHAFNADNEPVQTVIIKRIEAKFPDADGVMPDRVPAFVRSFDPTLLDAIGKMHKAMGSKMQGLSLEFGDDKNDGILVGNGDPDIQSVMMPIRA